MIRPGPIAIDPDQCRGGWVIHAYAVPSQRLLLTAPLPTIADADRLGEEHADLTRAAMRAGDIGVVLVVYDGDTGTRVRP